MRFEKSMKLITHHKIILKWHILREDNPAQEETKEERIIKPYFHS